MTILIFADKHPVVATIFSLSMVAVAVLGHKTVALVCRTALALFGTKKAPKAEIDAWRHSAPAEQQKAPRAPSTQKASGELETKRSEFRGCLADMGFTKAEYEKHVAAADMSLPIQELIRRSLVVLAKPVAKSAS